MLTHREQHSDMPIIHADSQVGLMVGYLTSEKGRSLSVQEAITLLGRYRKPSNDTARRLREARAFLRAYGITVLTTRHTPSHGSSKYESYTLRWNQRQIMKVRRILEQHPTSKGERRTIARGGR